MVLPLSPETRLLGRRLSLLNCWLCNAIVRVCLARLLSARRSSELDQSQDLARGPRKALVDGVSFLTAVRLAHPEARPGFILADGFHTAISAPTINDDVFQIGIPLQQHQADCLLNELRLVVRRRDDAAARGRQGLPSGMASGSWSSVRSMASPFCQMAGPGGCQQHLGNA